jgi:NADPH2:quinone reductase
MKAVVMTAPGGPEVLALKELPEPGLARATDVLVRVRAAGVNPVDTKMRAKPAGYPAPLPGVLGCDGAGTVEAAGAEVSGLRPGDEVYYCQAPHHEVLGSYAQYALVDHRLVAKKPRTLSFEEAAAVPLVLITAWEALHDRAGIRAGHKVLVHAGAGGVGHVAIQLARLAGADVCTTVGSADKAGFARALGAACAIHYREQNFVRAALDWTAGEGVDVCLDTVGGRTLAESFAATRHYGDVVTLLAPPPDLDWAVPRVRNQRVSFTLMLTPVFFGLGEAMARQGELLRRGAELVDRHRLNVHVDRVFPLERAAEAHALLASGGIKGKLVLAVS